MFSKVCLGEMH